MDLHEVVREITGHPVVDVTAVGGGDSGSSALVRLDDGTRVFTKHAESPEQSQAETAGLQWLAEAQAVAVPAVLGRRDSLLVLSPIEPGEPTAPLAEGFGRSLAELHAAGAPAHGSPPPGATQSFIGLAAMSTRPAERWPEFFAAQRIEPYLRDSVDNHALTTDEAQVVEQVMARIDALAGPEEPPARLHGDLWHGNVLWSEQGAHLVDPAAHGGHRETDLAMLQLFGCPHWDWILGAYQDTWPLADGWQARVGLHQLFPLLVHTALFGRSYAGQVVAVARAVLDGASAEAAAVPRRDVVTALREQIQADLHAVGHGVPERALARTKGHVRGLMDALVLALEADVGRPVSYAETRAVLSGQVDVDALRRTSS